MFAKLKESKLLKSLSEALFPVPRARTRRAAAANPAKVVAANPATTADSK